MRFVVYKGLIYSPTLRSDFKTPLFALLMKSFDGSVSQIIHIKYYIGIIIICQELSLHKNSHDHVR